MSAEAPAPPTGGAPLSDAGIEVLRRTQRHLQAIYAIEAPDVADFVVDAPTAAALAPGARVGREALLVSERDGSAEVAVFIAPELVAQVASRAPAAAVEEALDAWAVTVEVVSHFLLLAHRAGREEGVSLLELEAQAEVDKFVTASLVAGRDEPPGALRSRLFDGARLLPDLDPAERERYATAGRWADGYCRRLERLPHVGAVLVELRSFWRLSGHARLERMRRAA